MATKLIAFRLSGNYLDKALELFGDDINKKAQELLINFIDGIDPNTGLELKPDNDSKLRELETRIEKLESSMLTPVNTTVNSAELSVSSDQDNKLDTASDTADQYTTDGVNSNQLTPVNTTVNSAELSVSSDQDNKLDTASNTADQYTTDGVNSNQLTPVNSNQLTPVNSNQLTPVNSNQLTPVNSNQLTPVNSNQLTPVNTEKYYRHKLLERLGLSTKASKDQIIPKLKKLGVIVDRNSETFYQEACNQLGIV